MSFAFSMLFLLALLAVGFFIVRPIVRVYVAYRATVLAAEAQIGAPVAVSQSTVHGASQPLSPITGPASNTPAGAVAGQISQNGVTDTQRLATFVAWRRVNPGGGLWVDPWLTHYPNYAGTQIGPNDAAPPKGL